MHVWRGACVRRSSAKKGRNWGAKQRYDGAGKVWSLGRLPLVRKRSATSGKRQGLRRERSRKSGCGTSYPEELDHKSQNSIIVCSQG